MIGMTKSIKTRISRFFLLKNQFKKIKENKPKMRK